MAGLVLDLRPGETVRVGGPASIAMLSKSGRVARLCVSADRSTSIQLIRAQAEQATEPSPSMASFRPSRTA